MTSALLIYTNDQLALGILWREVARRAARENTGSDVGDALSEVARAIAEDVRTFEDMRRRLGLRRNPVKARPRRGGRAARAAEAERRRPLLLAAAPDAPAASRACRS